MSELKSKSNLQASTIGFDTMIQQFGVVTVMNARVYNDPLNVILGVADTQAIAGLKAHEVLSKILKSQSSYALIDSLKVANITVEGPSKTVTGGQYANPLIKFGKTATIEMQDALGRANVLEVLGGAVVEEYEVAGDIKTKNTNVVHITNDFVGPTTILGESFFIDQKTGTQVPVYILLYQVLPDAIFNLTQDSEGDATVFDLNGSLLATTITVGDAGDIDVGGIEKGVFYSILPKVAVTAGGPYTITFEGTLENPADADILALLNRANTTAKDGSMTMPTLEGYSFYRKNNGTEPIEEGTKVTFTAHTNIYVKSDSPAA